MTTQRESAPLFTVITVCLNSCATISEAVESVLNQDYTDLEYILVDGGSTDGTLDIIKQYAARDSRVRWLSETDRGISEAFNKGIHLATGTIIGIINSDDCYAPSALALVAKCYAAHPDCDVFHGDIARFQNDRQLFLLKPSDVPANIWHEMPLNHPATFVRRKTYELVGGFDTGLRFAMDYELILRIYRAGCCFQYIDQVLANMRYGGASDVNFLSARIEVYNVTVTAGYSRWKAAGWFVVKAGLNVIKNVLRKFGLYSLIRMHPKFARYKGGNQPCA